MTGIEKIIGRIAGDAQSEVDAVMAQAKTQADAVTAKYAEQAASERDELLKRGQKAAAEREERLASSAQMEAKKMMLAAKQEMLDAAFNKAMDAMCAMKGDEKVELLAKLAVRASSNGKEQIIMSQADRDSVGAEVVKRANAMLAAAGKDGAMTLSAKSGAFKGGLLLSDGDVEVNSTFETLVRLTRSEIAGEVAKVLFD